MRTYNEPTGWFGPPGLVQPHPMSITEIIAAGSMTTQLAALLWLTLDRGRSIIVASPPRLARHGRRRRASAG